MCRCINFNGRLWHRWKIFWKLSHVNFLPPSLLIVLEAWSSLAFDRIMSPRKSIDQDNCGFSSVYVLCVFYLLICCADSSLIWTWEEGVSYLSSLRHKERAHLSTLSLDTSVLRPFGHQDFCSLRLREWRLRRFELEAMNPVVGGPPPMVNLEIQARLRLGFLLFLIIVVIVHVQSQPFSSYRWEASWLYEGGQGKCPWC